MAESNQTGNGQSIVLAGRIVGMVRDHELVKRVQESKHLLRSPRGWAIDAHGYRFNRGFGDQVALQLKHWQLQGAATQQPLFA